MKKETYIQISSLLFIPFFLGIIATLIYTFEPNQNYINAFICGSISLISLIFGLYFGRLGNAEMSGGTN